MLQIDIDTPRKDMMNDLSSIEERTIGGMMFYIVEKEGESGYRRIYTKLEYDAIVRTITWLH